MTVMRENIKNIVFDMGKVIIDFDPEIFMDRLAITDEKDRGLLKEKIYDSPLWKQMDHGDLDEQRMIEIVEPELPDHLKSYARPLISRWYDPIIMIEGMSDLVFKLKRKGYGIYLLSNASVMQKDYWPSVSCASFFDGVVVSAFEHVMKPDPRIYEILLERFGLTADECIFIDDRKDNIEAAGKLGFDTFLFEGHADELERYIENES